MCLVIGFGAGVWAERQKPNPCVQIRMANSNFKSMTEETTRYCISARDRASGFTEAITEGMSRTEANQWISSGRKYGFTTHVYFRVSKHPFKRHKK